MRILHLIYDHVDNPWCGGGGALRVMEVNSRLAAEGHRILVVHGGFPGARPCSRRGVSWRPAGGSAGYIASRLRYMVSAPRLLRQFPSDIVVNDVSYFAPVLADRFTGRPVVNVVHHLMGIHALRLNPIAGGFPFLSEAALLANARHVITPAKSVRNDIANRFPGITAVDIANGVAEDYYSLSTEEHPFILFLGRIDVYMKGLDVLLEAFGGLSMPEIRLKIAGGGKAWDVRRLHRLVAGQRLGGRVEVLGRVSEAEKRELLRTCLFLVMPSRFEGWGITAIEANAAGKPVVATRISGLSEAVKEGAGAVLVPPGDPAALRAAIAALVVDAPNRQRQGRRARAHARKWSWDVIARKQLAFYRRILQDRKRAGQRRSLRYNATC